MASINVSIRMDSDLKEQAEQILSQLGMNLNGTINPKIPIILYTGIAYMSMLNTSTIVFCIGENSVVYFFLTPLILTSFRDFILPTNSCTL